MKSEVINNGNKDIGFKILVGGLFLIIGLLTINYFFGYLLILISTIAIFYKSGIEFDFDNKRVRKFQKYYGYTIGKWTGLDKYKRISIKKSRRGFLQYGGRTNASIKTLNTYYLVYLISSQAADRILLYNSKIRPDSEEFAKQWSEKLKVPVITYGQK